MKVLLLCMTFAAVSLAMPVAEDVVEPTVLAPVADAKSEKPQADVPLAEEKKPESTPEVQAEKAPEPELKNADKSVVAEVAAEPKAEESVGEQKEAVPVEIPIAKFENPEPKNIEEPKEPVKDTAQNIPNDVEPKSSATPHDAIDAISAVKHDAAIADDMVDVAGLNPVPVAAPKSEEIPEVKKDDVTVSAVDPVKPEEVKPAVKAAEESVVSTSDSTTEPKADKPKAVESTDDSLRVVRETVDVKPAVEEPKAEAEASSAAVITEEKNTPKPEESNDAAPQLAEPVEPKKVVEVKPDETSAPVVESKEKAAEKPESTEEVAPAYQPTPSEKSVEQEPAAVSEASAAVSEASAAVSEASADKVVEAIKPADVKPDQDKKAEGTPVEKPQGDAPAPDASSPNSSEEDVKKPNISEESSEESSESGEEKKKQS